MSRDSAMILWLDLNRNIKGRANENYGRELLELFTLGVGNYTERDVQEIARAFTAAPRSTIAIASIPKCTTPNRRRFLVRPATIAAMT